MSGLGVQGYVRGSWAPRTLRDPQVAIVTGASRGIGAAIAERLAKASTAICRSLPVCRNSNISLEGVMDPCSSPLEIPELSLRATRSFPAGI